MKSQNELLHLIDSTLQYINNYNLKQLKYDEKVDDMTKLPHSPAAERNKVPIFEELKHFLPETGIVLEIGSRHGQHCQYFAEQIHSTNLKTKIKCKWQPTDHVDECFNTIQQRINLSKVDIKSFILKPKLLNLLNNDWQSKYQSNNIKLIYISNVIHITDWQCTIGLFRGAGAILQNRDKLILYGPFIINDGNHESKNQSNMRFSISLQSRNKSWGVRNVEDIDKVASKYGLKQTQKLNMPANNYLVIFEKV